MKALIAGNLLEEPLRGELAEKAEKENVDLVILCGNVMNNGENRENTISPFVKKNKKVLLIPGDHEIFATVDFAAEFYHPAPFAGYSLKVNGIGFFGFGSANSGPKLEEEEISATLKKAFEPIKDLKVKVMITPIHPSKSLMEKLSSFVPGSNGVRKAIEDLKPDILLCFHLHEAGGMEEIIGETRVINIGGEGKVLDL